MISSFTQTGSVMLIRLVTSNSLRRKFMCAVIPIPLFFIVVSRCSDATEWGILAVRARGGKELVHKSHGRTGKKPGPEDASQRGLAGVWFSKTSEDETHAYPHDGKCRRDQAAHQRAEPGTP